MVEQDTNSAVLVFLAVSRIQQLPQNRTLLERTWAAITNLWSKPKEPSLAVASFPSTTAPTAIVSTTPPRFDPPVPFYVMKAILNSLRAFSNQPGLEGRVETLLEEKGLDDLFVKSAGIGISIRLRDKDWVWPRCLKHLCWSDGFKVLTINDNQAQSIA